MSDTGYRRIIETLDAGRRALARARLTAGLLRFGGTVLATGAGLVLWAALQRGLRFYSVPVATLVSVLGAGIVVFALVRWVVIPLVRLPGRDEFVGLVEERFPQEKNLIVNAYQLGGDAGEQRDRAPDLVDALVARASDRVSGLDLRRWRDPAPDRPFLWAGAAALAAMALLAVISPGLMQGALGQALRPARAEAPPVAISVLPGNVEVDRGADVPVTAEVTGTGKAPSLHFRETNGAWRTRDFDPVEGRVTRDGGTWEAVVPEVDRNLEYRVEAPRAESDIFAIIVREPPRIVGFRAHLLPPAYSGLPAETVTAGTGDITALKGTDVDLRVLTNRIMKEGWLDWLADEASESVRLPLTAVDATGWKTDFRMMEPASYAVVLVGDEGRERLRSPRYRIEPAPDRAPYLTLHFPQEDHDLADDMMEQIVADAADDYGFSSVRLFYRIDDGPENSVSYRPYTAGQTEFRLDTLWDLSGFDLAPGSVVAYHLEVRDNDTVSGPKAVRSPVRRVRFPTLGEIFAEVAEEHDEEIEGLSELYEEQNDVLDRLERLNEELKRGKDLDWDMRRDVEKTLEKQQSLEEQVADVATRLQETLQKADDRARMDMELVRKMAEINDLLDGLHNEQLKRSFQALSKALDSMNKDAVRKALEEMQDNQEEMLAGLERTIELLKQIRRDEQVEDVVRRTEEIAQLEDAIAEELEKHRDKMEPEGGPSEGERPEGEMMEGERPEGEQPPGEPQEGEEPDGEKKDGEQPDGESQESEPSEGEDPDGEKKDGEQSEGDQSQGEQKDGEQKEGEQKEGGQQEGGQSQQGSEPQESDQDQPESEQKEKMKQLAEEQERVEQLVEELKRQLEMLRKLNEDAPDMTQSMEEMERSQALADMQKSMANAQQGMQQGSQQKASKYAFQARDQANSLAEMAKNMQQQMQQEMQDDSIERMEAIIQGLIDVSGAQELLVRGGETDHRLLAQRQLNLLEASEAWGDSLRDVSKQSFALGNDLPGKLSAAKGRMERATRLYEQGDRRSGAFQARESASDLNETIVELMQSHSQMCAGQSGGDQSSQMRDRMSGLSDAQQQLNESTEQMMQRLQGQGRLSRTDEERMAQLAAQQEMIRQGIEELQAEFSEAEDLLGDMDRLQEEMEEVVRELEQKSVDPRVVERQQKILSRLLDAQRSIRQQEMSPRRESRSATLAQRRSPPPVPDDLLRRERTLEEDVLRGADDRYPAQYRKLVEEYFRALSRETRTP